MVRHAPYQHANSYIIFRKSNMKALYRSGIYFSPLPESYIIKNNLVRMNDITHQEIIVTYFYIDSVNDWDKNFENEWNQIPHLNKGV